MYSDLQDGAMTDPGKQPNSSEKNQSWELIKILRKLILTRGFPILDLMNLSGIVAEGGTYFLFQPVFPNSE